jgi:hypothetical protein
MSLSSSSLCSINLYRCSLGLFPRPRSFQDALISEIPEPVSRLTGSSLHSKPSTPQDSSQLDGEGENFRRFGSPLSPPVSFFFLGMSCFASTFGSSYPYLPRPSHFADIIAPLGYSKPVQVLLSLERRCRMWKEREQKIRFSTTTLGAMANNDNAVAQQTRSKACLDTPSVSGMVNKVAMRTCSRSAVR